MSPDPAGRITLQKNPARVRVLSGDILIADTCNALELRENGYPPRQYLPREDVNTALLEPSQTVTHCPFKGDAIYYDVILDGRRLSNAAWSYEGPFESMATLRGRLAFAAPDLSELIGEG